MIGSSTLESLANSLFSALPQSLQDVEKSVKQEFKTILQSTFAKMDLVTREEFDVQVKVLARTREKLVALETQLNALTEKNKL